jgi:hypothetical protein
MQFKVVGYGARGCPFAAREVSGNLGAGSVLALGGGGLSIEASGNLEKRKCPWAYECEPAVEQAGSYVRRF